MVNTRTDAELSAAVQNALQTLLPQIREEIREEFRTGSGSSNAGGNPLPFFPRAEQERLKREYHSIRQTSTETSTEYMQCFLRLAGFLGAVAGTEEEQAKNFQWGFRRETGVISLTDLPIQVLSSPGVPLRATLIQFALLVDVDTQESVVELLVLVSSMVKLVIYRKIARRTPLRLHLVWLIRSQGVLRHLDTEYWSLLVMDVFDEVMAHTPYLHDGYGILVLEKDSKASKSKKERYKSLALKAKKVLSDKEYSCLDSDDEQYAMAVLVDKVHELQVLLWELIRFEIQLGELGMTYLVADSTPDCARSYSAVPAVCVSRAAAIHQLAFL
nr:zinc finger, CCHC-type, retrotransposon Gag domain protein [Tanacetum cinerariifolium]